MKMIRARIRDISGLYLKFFNKNIDSDDVNIPINFLDIGDNNRTIRFLNNSDSERKLMDRNISGFSDDIKRLIIFDENEMSISFGRATRRFLKSSKLNKSDSEIEKFVNAYKYEYDMKYSGHKFEILKGKDILKGYNCNSYIKYMGTLSSSCMNVGDNGLPQNEWFKIYTDNENISLLVLNNGSGDIIGRSLLWKLTDGNIFMDRIYTSMDSDLLTFREYAKENKWIFKSKNAATPSFMGDSAAMSDLLSPSNNYKDTMNIKMEVKVNSDIDENFTKFPYLDTMKYYYWETGFLKNYPDTSEYYIGLEDDKGDFITCRKCMGTGNINDNGIKHCDKCGGYKSRLKNYKIRVEKASDKYRY